MPRDSSDIYDKVPQAMVRHKEEIDLTVDNGSCSNDESSDSDRDMDPEGGDDEEIGEQMFQSLQSSASSTPTAIMAPGQAVEAQWPVDVYGFLEEGCDIAECKWWWVGPAWPSSWPAQKPAACPNRDSPAAIACNSRSLG